MQEYWSGLSFPSLGDLPSPGIELASPVLQMGSLSLEPSGKASLHGRCVFNSQPCRDPAVGVRNGEEAEVPASNRDDLIFLKRSLVFPILLFSSISLH